MRYFVGLDNGGTATKASVFDEHGVEVGSCGVSTRALTPSPGLVERDMEEMGQANCAVVKGALERSGVRAQDVAGIGVSGHGKGLYLWGKDDAPVRNGIISTDDRAWRYVQRWREEGVEREAGERTLQHVMACQPGPLLAWVKDREPENYANIRWVFECKDYVRFRLTGKAGAELSDYSGSGLMDLRTKRFDPAILALYGIPEVAGALPPLCRATEVCGVVTEEAARLTGLLPGTPVTGGMFDIDACAIGSGVVAPDLICMIAGTWSINEFIRREPVLGGKVRMNSLFSLPGYYLVEESSPTSAGNLSWFVRQFPELDKRCEEEGKSVYDLLDEWVEEVPPTEFVPVFLPFLMGSNVHPNARGSFVGMSLSHTRKHLARSVFEGITFCHRTHLERLLQAADEPPRAIRLAGGAARAAVWAQMFADVCGLPVETVAASETGALGVAIATAVAVGAYDTVEDAVAAMVSVSGRFEPRYDLRRIYDGKYDLYCKTVDALDGVWDDMQKLVDA